MKQIFSCEKCGNTFDFKDECIEHEGYCQKNIPTKGIFMENYFDFSDDFKFDIHIMEYPNAVLFGKDKINLNANDHHFISADINLLHLDKVWTYGNTLGIFTTNFDKVYEKECIRKLVEKRKENINKYYDRVSKSIGLELETLKNMNYTLYREEDARQVISGDIYDWFIIE